VLFEERKEKFVSPEINVGALPIKKERERERRKLVFKTRELYQQ